MRLVLLGAPGSGKGTQGAILAEHLGVPYLSTGDLLRKHAAAGTDLGRKVASYLNRGDLVPDELVLALVGDALSDSAMKGRGYVLDGFPRTLAQAHFTDALAPPEAVIHLALPDEVARQRLAGRTGDRTDDARADAVERRLGHYHAETEPLLDFYRRRGTLRTVKGDQSPEAVTAAIIDALD